jgi:hypothetical protein
MDFLRYVSKEAKSDFETVMGAVKCHGSNLEHASNELKNNFEIVMEAVKTDGTSLEYASNELKNNFDIVMEAVKTEGLSLVHASKRLKNNKTLIYTALLNETELQLDYDCLYLQIDDYSKKLNYFKCFVNHFDILFLKFLGFDLNFIFYFDNQKRKFNEPI